MNGTTLLHMVLTETSQIIITYLCIIEFFLIMFIILDKASHHDDNRNKIDIFNDKEHH